MRHSASPLQAAPQWRHLELLFPFAVAIHQAISCLAQLRGFKPLAHLKHCQLRSAQRRLIASSSMVHGFNWLRPLAHLFSTRTKLHLLPHFYLRFSYPLPILHRVYHWGWRLQIHHRTAIHGFCLEFRVLSLRAATTLFSVQTLRVRLWPQRCLFWFQISG